MPATPAAGEEFCTKPPKAARWIGLVGLYLNAVFMYATGGVALMISAFVIGVMLWGLAKSLPHPSFGSYYVEIAGGLAMAAMAVLMLRTGRLSLRAIRLGREVSLKVDDIAIHVRDIRGNQYEIGMKQIERLEIRKSFWLGTRICVYLASGERHHLPQVRDHDLLIDRIVRDAGLNSRYRQGRLDVYSRDTQV